MAQSFIHYMRLLGGILSIIHIFMNAVSSVVLLCGVDAICAMFSTKKWLSIPNPIFQII